MVSFTSDGSQMAGILKSDTIAIWKLKGARGRAVPD
jgi:hypothetical protein